MGTYAWAHTHVAIILLHLYMGVRDQMWSPALHRQCVYPVSYFLDPEKQGHLDLIITQYMNKSKHHAVQFKHA